MESAAEARERPTTQPPRWMRRGTILTLIVLAILALGLVGYFLLPGVWANAIGSMTRGTPAWAHGIGLGIVSTAAAIGTAVAALRLRRRAIEAPAPEADEQPDEPAAGERPERPARSGRPGRPARSARHAAVIVLIVATALLAAPTLLTLLIATGLTEPLARADVDLRITAPGFTVGTLIGLVLTAIAAGAGRLLWTNRARSRRGSEKP